MTDGRTMTQSAPADAIDAVLAEHADLERQLSDPDSTRTPPTPDGWAKRFAQLAPIATVYRKLTAARGDLGGGARTGRRRLILRRRGRRTRSQGRRTDDQLTTCWLSGSARRRRRRSRGEIR